MSSASVDSLPRLRDVPESVLDSPRLGCIRVDVRDFSRFNLNHGIPAGDEVILAVWAGLQRGAPHLKWYWAGADRFVAFVTDAPVDAQTAKLDLPTDFGPVMGVKMPLKVYVGFANRSPDVMSDIWGLLALAELHRQELSPAP